MAKGSLSVWLLYVFYWSSGGNGKREGGAGGERVGVQKKAVQKRGGEGKRGHGTGGGAQTGEGL